MELVATEEVHGTRTRYVKGCRCDLCKRANRLYARERVKRSREMAEGMATVVATRRRVKSCFGEKKVVLKRCCLGLDGTGCPTKSSLREDSAGNLCSTCRGQLLSRERLVLADRARRHLKYLSRMGIGKRTVSDASHVALSSVQEVGAGRMKRITRATERAIMAVDRSAMNGQVLLAVEPYWRLVDELVDAGFTLRAIAKGMGYAGNGLQMRYDVITAAKARKLELFHKKALVDEESDEFVGGDPVFTTCLECGLSHRMESRLKILRRMLPCTPRDVAEAYPCIWPAEVDPEKGACAPRMLFRDLHKLGASSNDGTWDVVH